MSRVYVHAIATRARYTIANFELDRDGIDLKIQAGGAMRPALDLQLKATVNLGEPKGGCFRFPLKQRNYNLLCMEVQTPRLLVVLDLPKDKERWMTVTADELVLRHRAYWLNLRGHEETTNQSSITVQIPEENLFNVEKLRVLMEQSRGGKIQ